MAEQGNPRKQNLKKKKKKNLRVCGEELGTNG